MDTKAIQDQLASSIHTGIAPIVDSAIEDMGANAGNLSKAAVGAIARKVLGKAGFYPVPLPDLPDNATSAQLLEHQKLLEQAAADDKLVSAADLQHAQDKAALTARAERLAQAITATIAGAAVVAGRQSLANALDLKL